MSRSASIAAAGLALFVVFNLNLRAIGSRDTHVTEYTALSLAAHGDVTLDEYPDLTQAGLARGYVTKTRDGHVVSDYPVVPAAIAAPAYWIAVRVGGIDPARPVPARVEAVGKLVASALTAIACALLMARLARDGDVPAVAVACAVALGTPLWPSASQALWTHAPAAALLAAALWWTHPPSRVGGRRAEALRHNDADRRADAVRHVSAGVAFALAATCRPLLIVFLAGAFIDLIRMRDARAIALAAGATVTLGAIAIFNVATFGTALGGQQALESAAVHWQTHLIAGAWSTTPFAGLPGILISPSRGVLIYAPVLAYAAVGAWRARGDRRLLWRVTLPVVAFVIGWSQYAVWWGGHSYGPRYASDVAIPCGILIASAWRGGSFRRLRVAIVTWSIAVQAVGAWAYPGGAWNAVPADVDRAHERLWDWRDPQIVRTLRAGLYHRPS